MDIIKLLNYMENLRYDRKMSQEVYLHDVISQRQYYRYRNGESEVPFDVIVKFANKLQIPLLKLISSYQTYSEKEKEIVKEYFNLVLSKRLIEAKQFISKQKSLMLLDDETKLFYQVSRILHDFYQNKITNIQLLEKLKKQINFNDIMKKEMLHDIEIYLIGLIMEYSEKDRELIFAKIDSLRRNDKLLLGGNSLLDLQVYFLVIKNLGRMNRYLEVIEMADLALEYTKRTYTYYLKEYFYYYKALAYYFLNQKEKFEESLFCTVISLNQLDNYKRNHFIEMVKKDTNIDCKDFLEKNIKKRLF